MTCSPTAAARFLQGLFRAAPCTAPAGLRVSGGAEPAATPAAGPPVNVQAFAVIQAEYGVPASQVFSSISPEAVAGE